MTYTLTLDVHRDWLLSANDRPHWAVKARKTQQTEAAHQARIERGDPTGPLDTSWPLRPYPESEAAA